MPALTPEQAKTFRQVSPEEHARFKQGRGRPRKSAEEKTRPVTLRIEPSLLLLLKNEAMSEGLPWQTYLKMILKKGLQEKSPDAALD
jgi:predicted DNA binding CopG/RHH family protein